MLAFFPPAVSCSHILRRRPPRLSRVAMATMTQSVAEERFDILDASGAPTGFSESRSVVHRDGLWHRSTHIWVVSRCNRALLMQRRAATKDTFPGRWDVSAAGHITSGADSETTAQRELEEELGLKGPLSFLFTARAEARGTVKSGPFVDREHQDVYVLDKEVNVEDVRLQEDEVECVQYWPVDDVRKAFELGDDGFVPRSEEYVTNFLPWLESYLSADA